MKNSVFMEEMDAFTYREKLAKDAVVFIPVGALEQHGSHMAMCVDAALTKAMAGATASISASSSAVRMLRYFFIGTNLLGFSRKRNPHVSRTCGKRMPCGQTSRRSASLRWDYPLQVPRDRTKRPSQPFGAPSG